MSVLFASPRALTRNLGNEVESQLLNPFSEDEVLLNHAGKNLPNSSYSMTTYINHAVLLNIQIERALSRSSPSFPLACARIAELSSLVNKSTDARVVNESELVALTSLARALLARRAADLIIAYQAPRVLELHATGADWRVLASALCRLALHWLAAFPGSTPAVTALVALEALEANAIRTRLGVEEKAEEALMDDEEFAGKISDAINATSPRSSSNPVLDYITFKPTLSSPRSGTHISFIPTGGFQDLLKILGTTTVSPFSRERYAKCFGALTPFLDNGMLMRRLVNLLRLDAELQNGWFVCDLLSSIPPYPSYDENSAAPKDQVTQFDVKAFLLMMYGWTRESFRHLGRCSSPFPCPLPDTAFEQNHASVWRSLIVSAQKRKMSGLGDRMECAKSIRDTRLTSLPPLPLLVLVFKSIKDDAQGCEVAEKYAYSIIDACQSIGQMSTLFPKRMTVTTEEETSFYDEAALFLGHRRRQMRQWKDAESQLLSVSSSTAVLKEKELLYIEWINSSPDAEEQQILEKKLLAVKASLHALSTPKQLAARSEGEKGKSRSPAIALADDGGKEGEDTSHNRSSMSDYASAMGTPQTPSMPVDVVSPAFFTPSRASLLPGLKPSPVLDSPRRPETKEMEVQTDAIVEDSSTILRESVETRTAELVEESFVVGEAPSLPPQPKEENAPAAAPVQVRRRSPSFDLNMDDFAMASVLEGLDVINKLYNANSTRMEKSAKQHEEQKKRIEERQKEREWTAEAANVTKVATTPTHRPLTSTTSIAHQAQPVSAAGPGGIFGVPSVPVVAPRQGLPAAPLLTQLLTKQRPPVPAPAPAPAPNAFAEAFARQKQKKEDEEKAKAEEEKARAEEEKARADEEKARADEEKARADEEKARADEEKARADEEKAKAEKAKAKEEARRHDCICCGSMEEMDEWMEAYDQLVALNDAHAYDE